MRKFKHGPRGRLLFAPTSQRPFHSTQSQSPHCAPPSCSVGTTGGPEARGHSLPQPMAPRPGHTPLLCPGPRPARSVCHLFLTCREGHSLSAGGSSAHPRWGRARNSLSPTTSWAGPEAGRVPEAVGTRQRHPPSPGGENGHIILKRLSHTAHTEGWGAAPGCHRAVLLLQGFIANQIPRTVTPHKRSEAHCRPPSPPQKRGPASSASIHFLEATSPPSSRARVGGWPVTSASQSPPRLF